jgi:preprotein translocase subunit YajC
MANWFTTALLAVEEVPGAAASGGAPASSEGPGFQGIVVLLLPALIVMFLFQLLGNNPRKQAAQQLERLKNLKKNDPVATIGGIRGNFVSLSEDGSEVTLQLNDNVRVRFEASAIRSMPAPTPPAKS